MMVFDPRTLGKPVYEALQALYAKSDNSRRKEQKSQAQEIYTYLSTWGMLRLKAEEDALRQAGKKEIVQTFFTCLEQLSDCRGLSGSDGLKTLKNLSTDDYLGLSGLALAVAREFSFWTTAIYASVEAES